MYKKAFDDLARGVALWPVWTYQAWHEMTARYKRTFLGTFWLAGSMVVTSIALALVWGGLMNRDLHEVLPYIMGGIMCFSLVAFPLNEGAELYLGSAGMIRNHAHPFSYYGLETVGKMVLTFAHNLIIFWIVVAFVRALSVPHWTLLLGFPIVLITMFTWGSVLGVAAARFRDLRFLLPYIGQLLFYITPVIWYVGDISNKRAWIANFNPLYGLLDVIRAPLLGQAPVPHAWSLALGSMIVGVILWLVIFPVFRKRIPFWV